MNDLHDNSSRRAFPLDSRAVWVEQQLVHQVLLPRDNLSIGPGAYSPVLPSRHVASPALGKFREPVDFLRHHGSKKRTQEIRSNSPDNSTIFPENSEFKTIFHNHDARQPFDPKLRFCETPGPLLGQDEIFKTTSVEGTTELHKTVRMEPWSYAQEERFHVKPGLPSYDINFNSPQIKRTTQLGSFPKTKRIYIPLKGDKSSDSFDNEGVDRGQSGSPPSSAVRHRRSESPSLLERRCALVKLPKLKTRTAPVMLFNDSSYRNEKLAKPLDLTPSVVNKKAYVHIFDKYLKIPRSHKSTGFTHYPG